MTGMDIFELRPLETGVELSGGKLEAPMVFCEADAEQRAINLVGFLSQRDGGVLRILDASGVVVATKEFRENPLATSALADRQHRLVIPDWLEGSPLGVSVCCAVE